jgi:uncharacterized membrane protein YfcA
MQQRFYPVRRPVATFCVGAAVAVLGGLIGLGGAEFRLPLLIAIFELYPQRAIRINLLISLATLAVSALARLGFTQDTQITDFLPEIAAMVAGGVVAAWIGAGALLRIPKERVVSIIAVLLIAIAGLLIMETVFAGSTHFSLPPDQLVRVSVAMVVGIVVGTVSSMLGVAGGELIIPMLIFIFGADIKTAGTSSVLISVPIVIAGITRHILTGHFRSRSMLAHLVLPMSIGSALGAIAGGYMAAWAPSDALRVLLGATLAVSAVKLMRKH